MQITNSTGIPLPLAVWLAGDGYDFTRGTRKAISATSLLKGVRKILLAERLDDSNRLTPDVSDFIASRLGHTIHDGIEKAWKGDTERSEALRTLGIPERIIKNIIVNPTPEQLRASNEKLPVYLEQRTEREFMGYIVTGKFDMIFEGVIQDFKSTSVYTMIHGSKDEDYRIQGSIYRWLNRDKVTADYMMINFIFTDWTRGDARRDPKYPQQRLMPYKVDLLSLEEIERWMRAKFQALEAAADLPEDKLPRCSDEELWRGETLWKYYADPAKANDPAARSTKNFDNAAEAAAFKASKGGKGVVIEVPGKVKACAYCPAFPICTQKDEYEHG